LTSDEILVCKSLQGELYAFEELVNRYKNQIFALVYRMVGQYQEAEDITQEVFIMAYEKLYQFDMSKKFSPWIYKIAVNSSFSALRKKKKVVMLNFEDNYRKTGNGYHPANISDPQLTFERKELKEEIKSAISELPDSYRAVIILRYEMDLDNQEIAEVLDISKQNVEVRIHRARKALRKILVRRWEERGIKDELQANR